MISAWVVKTKSTGLLYLILLKNTTLENKCILGDLITLCNIRDNALQIIIADDIFVEFYTTLI